MFCQQNWVTGASFPGGFAQKVIALRTALARIPDGLSFVDAAPLACAGVTTFNSLRQAGAGPGDVVAILGLGGLGHLGVQFAAKMGYRTVAIARGQDKADLAINSVRTITSIPPRSRWQRNSRSWVGPEWFWRRPPTSMQ